MKKTIWTVIMLIMLASPCLAQEVEPDGLFSIEGTEWQVLPIGLQIFPFPFIYFTSNHTIRFYKGEVYEANPPGCPNYDSFYIDMPLFSIFGTRPPSITVRQCAGASYRYFGILQPIGIGMMIVSRIVLPIPLPQIIIVPLIKTNDNWIPPEPEPEVE